MKKDDGDRKEEILKLLKKYKEMPTSKIGHLTNTNYYKIENFLMEMEVEGKIKKRQGKQGVYWSLNEE